MKKEAEQIYYKFDSDWGVLVTTKYPYMKGAARKIRLEKFSIFGMVHNGQRWHGVRTINN